MYTRRRVLTTGTAVLLGTLTGCLGVLKNDEPKDNGNDTNNQNSTGNGNESANGGDTNRDENGEENGDDATSYVSYTDWLATDIVGEHWSVTTLSPSRVAEIERVDNLGFGEDLAGIGDSDIDRVISLSEAGLGGDRESLVVMVGSFDSQIMVEALRESDVEGELVEEGAYHEYELYSSGFENSTIIGIRDGVAAFATSRETFERGVDAHRGEATRLHETDQRFRRLHSTLSVSDSVEFTALDSFGGAAIANGYDYAPDESRFELVVHHTSSDAAGSLAGDIETEVMDLTLVDPSITTDDEIVSLSAGEPTNHIDNDSPGRALVENVRSEIRIGLEEPASLPIVSIDSQYDPQTEELRISHVSGDMFTAGQVRFEGMGSPDSGSSWAQLSTKDDVTPTTQIGAGSSVTLHSVDPDFDIALVWTSADGEMTETLGTFQGPDA